MADTKQNSQTENPQAENPQAENPQAEQAQTTELPNFKSDRDAIRQTSQLFFLSLVKAGVHIAMAPVYILPEEPREHFISAGREFTRGLSTLAQEIADDFDKLVSKDNE